VPNVLKTEKKLITEAIKVGDKFSTYEQLQAAVSQHEQENYVWYNFGCACSIAAAAKCIPKRQYQEGRNGSADPATLLLQFNR